MTASDLKLYHSAASPNSRSGSLQNAASTLRSATAGKAGLKNLIARPPKDTKIESVRLFD
jgi:hypothetical protein